jgi:hypothetical protein
MACLSSFDWTILNLRTAGSPSGPGRVTLTVISGSAGSMAGALIRGACLAAEADAGVKVQAVLLMMMLMLMNDKEGGCGREREGVERVGRGRGAEV